MGKLNKQLQKMKATPFTSDKENISNENFLKEKLNTCFIGCAIHSKDQFSDKQLEEIKDKIFSSTYSDDIDRGSASNPIYTNNWSVGIFGSIWVDFQLKDETQIRCSLIHKKDTPDKTDHILYLKKENDLEV